MKEKKEVRREAIKRLTATQVCGLVFLVSVIGRQRESGGCAPKGKRKWAMQREREVQWYKAYKRVVFMQSLLANISRQICLFQLQKFNKSCSVAATFFLKTNDNKAHQKFQLNHSQVLHDTAHLSWLK